MLSVHSYLCYSEESWGDSDFFEHSSSQKLPTKGSIERKLELELFSDT